MEESSQINQPEIDDENDLVTRDTELTSEVIHNTNESNVPKQLPEALNKPVKHLKLPFSKVKQIMKMDPDVAIIQQDAAFLVCKATELFIEYLTRETNKQLANSKRKTVMKRDVDMTIETIPQLCFLDGALE